MLAGLRHRAVVGSYHQDSAVHLRGAGDHFFDVIGMTRTIDLSVMALGSLVLNMRDGDGDTALAFLRGLVDLIESGELGKFPRRQNLGYRRGQCCLAVVDMSDSADVKMRLVSLEFGLAHDYDLP